MELTLESVFTDKEALCEDLLEGRARKSRLLRLTTFLIAGSALYGFSMGLKHSRPQACMAAVKVPALFFLTLIICLPTLHFVGLFFGSRIKLEHSLSAMLMGLATTGILLSAFAPVSLFFLASNSQYEFLLLMHVGVFVFAGAAGLQSIKRSLEYLSRRSKSAVPSGRSDLIFQLWMGMYMFVGTQMAYAMAPFIGNKPEFISFRAPEGNFYTYVLDAIITLFQ